MPEVIYHCPECKRLASEYSKAMEVYREKIAPDYAKLQKAQEEFDTIQNKLYKEIVEAKCNEYVEMNNKHTTKAKDRI